MLFAVFLFLWGQHSLKMSRLFRGQNIVLANLIFCWLSVTNLGCNFSIILNGDWISLVKKTSDLGWIKNTLKLKANSECLVWNWFDQMKKTRKKYSYFQFSINDGRRYFSKMFSLWKIHWNSEKWSHTMLTSSSKNLWRHWRTNPVHIWQRIPVFLLRQ